MSFEDNLVYGIGFGALAIISLVLFIKNAQKKVDSALSCKIKLLLIIRRPFEKVINNCMSINCDDYFLEIIAIFCTFTAQKAANNARKIT